jgi:hypothetical protein
MGSFVATRSLAGLDYYLAPKPLRSDAQRVGRGKVLHQRAVKRPTLFRVMGGEGRVAYDEAQPST